jgi:hypothetical protein
MAVRAMSALADALIAGAPADAAEVCALPRPAPPLINAAAAAFDTPQPHVHATLPLPPHEPGNDDALLSDFIAGRIAAMAPLLPSDAVPPPVAIDAAHVRAMLTRPFGVFQRCASVCCVGHRLPGNYALRQYISPAQLAHYHATGLAPEFVDGGVCYLCMLSFGIVLAETGSPLPFFHLVNSPGGYVPEAMHPSIAGDGQRFPVRRLSLDDYVEMPATVFQPEQHGPDGVATQWSALEVAGYSERIELLFGAAHLPVPRTAGAPRNIVGVGGAPPCEAVLMRNVLDKAAAIETRVDRIAEAAGHTLGVWQPSLALTLGGVVAPPTVYVPAERAPLQQRVWLLTLAPLPEARAALLYLVLAAGNNWLDVVRELRLMPSQLGVERARDIEVRCPIAKHMLLYLVLARCAELDRMLADGAAELGGPALGRPDALRAVLAQPGVPTQLRAYRLALQPLRDELMRRFELGDGAPLADTYWWSPEDSAELLPYLRWAPAPARDYYTAVDLVSYPLSVAAVPLAPAASPALVQAINSLPSSGMASKYLFAALCKHVSFDDACYAVPSRVLQPYWSPPPGATGFIWRTLAWRINAAYEVLRGVCAQLAVLPDDGSDAAELLVATAGSLGAMCSAAAAGCVDVMGVRRRTRLADVAQELKQMLASHVPLVEHLLAANALDDAAARVHLAEHAPRHNWARGMVCAATLFAAPFTARDFVAAGDVAQSLYAWVLGAAAPIGGIDIVARWRYAASVSTEWLEWSRQAVYATLVGAYAHARNVVPFDCWVALRRAVWEGPAADYEHERLLLIVLRDHLVHAAARAPAARLGIRAIYAGWPVFAAHACNHADRVRSRAGDAVAVAEIAAFAATDYAKAVPWPPFHRPPQSFVAVLADAVRIVDIELCMEACIRARRVLTAAELTLPDTLVRGIGAWVEREPRPVGGFDAAWLREVGVAEAAVGFVAATQREYDDAALTAATVTERMRRLAATDHANYVRVAAFVSILVVHARRSLMPLDADTRARQARVAGGNSVCTVSSVQCCNTMRTIVAQDDSALGGTMRVRLNLDTGVLTCVSRRGRSYAASRAADRNSTTAAVARAMREWNDGGSELVVRERLRAYLHPLVRERYALLCDTMAVVTWPVVGAVFVQHTSDSVVDTCTVCPRCGAHTAFSASMFSSNLFSCGQCEAPLRAQLARAAEQQCVFCRFTPSAARRAVQSACATAQLDAAHPAHYMVLDDLIEGTAVPRRVWVCGVCNERWMPTAVSHFSLCELMWLRDNVHEHGGNMVAMIDSEQHAALLRDVRRARADPRVPVPAVGQASVLGKPVRKRKIGSVKL